MGRPKGSKNKPKLAPIQVSEVDLQTCSVNELLELSPKKKEQFITNQITARFLILLKTNQEEFPVNLDSPDEVKNRGYWYFDQCAKYGITPTHSGIATSMGISRQRIYNWYTGKRRSRELQAVFDELLTFMQAWTEELGNNGTINTVRSIWLEKADMGKTETPVVTAASSGTHDATMSAEDIMKLLTGTSEVIDADFTEVES